MIAKINQAEKLKTAQDYFRRLDIEGWEETNSPIQGGGQATILVVKRSDGTKGAFRFTTKSDIKALDRFAREIKILSEYEHPNILKILDHSKDITQPWYISELGDSFDKYWKRRCQQLVDDSIMLVRDTIEVVRQLADGLASLHEKGIVHRDIKPANIIVKKSDSDIKQPVLIDFGLAYVESQPRLSDVNETVGNLRFSPDVAMYRMENVPPWLDVHNLAQLFMWMVRINPDKDWQRALDPRWVNYDDRLPEDLILSIRAFTASCSEQNVSPKSARELINFIDQLFPQTLPQSQTIINVSKIEKGRRRGLAVSSLAIAEDTRIIEASFPIIAKTYLALRQGLDPLFAACSDARIYVNKESDPEIDSFRLRLLEHDGIKLDQPLVHWEIGDGRENIFSFRIYIDGLVSSRRGEFLAGGGQIPSDSSNPFSFHLLLRRSQIRGTFPNKTKIITINDQASLSLRDSIIGEATTTSIFNIVEMVKEWIEDPEVWEALHKFK